MITVLIAGAITGAYLAAALFAGRHEYGRQRSCVIDDYVADRKGRSLDEAVENFYAREQGLTAVLAVGFGLFWPVAIPLFYGGASTVRWFDQSAPKSDAELDAERHAMQKRIRELERELQVGDSSGI